MKFGAFAAALLFAAPAFAFDERPYVGTWMGQTPTGAKAIAMTIPAGVSTGSSVTYSFDNQDQGPQTPKVIGKRLRLDNPSGTYMIVGPPKENRLPFFWTNGERKTTTVLVRQ